MEIYKLQLIVCCLTECFTDFSPHSLQKEPTDRENLTKLLVSCESIELLMPFHYAASFPET